MSVCMYLLLPPKLIIQRIYMHTMSHELYAYIFIVIISALKYDLQTLYALKWKFNTRLSESETEV